MFLNISILLCLCHFLRCSCLFPSLHPVESHPLCLIVLFWFLLLRWCLSEGWEWAGVQRLCVSWNQNKQNSLWMSLTHYRIVNYVCVCTCLKIYACCLKKFLSLEFSSCWCLISKQGVQSSTKPHPYANRSEIETELGNKEFIPLKGEDDVFKHQCFW